MKKYIFIDVSKKQEFIFKSNKLKNNMLNSLIIEAVTEDYEFTRKEDPSSQVKLCLRKNLEKYSNCHVLYSGGGNSIIEFQDGKDADDFTKIYSRAVLEKFPDLELYISAIECESFEENFTENKMKLDKKCDEIKDQRKSTFRRISYGVEYINEVGRPNIEKLKNDRVTSFMRKRFSEKLNVAESRITYKLDTYKNNTLNSQKPYIGVISIDGNRMGEIVSKAEKANALKEISKSIEKIYSNCVSEALKKFPDIQITPIIMSGDDICFITEAEYAIQLTASILENIQMTELSNHIKLKSSLDKVGIKNLSACAGITIVKASYPFFEAVQIAEEMCHRSKEALYKNKGNENASFIDWTIIKGGKREEQEYRNFIKDKNNESIFNIKPLKIDSNSKILFDGKDFYYNKFKDMIFEISQSNNENSFYLTASQIQKIRESIYRGEIGYNTIMDLHVDQSEKLNKKFEEICKGDINDDFELKKCVVHKNNKRIYILKDMLDSLDFFREEKWLYENCNES